MIYPTRNNRKIALVAMTVMMAVPAMMMMVRMSNSNDNLAARCRYQRSEEHHSEKSKRKFLHGIRPLLSL
jgi:hypothetical protein